MILDYSQYLEDCTYSRVTAYHGVTHDIQAVLPGLFFRKGECPFCKKPASQVYDNTDEVVHFPGDGYGNMISAWNCSCGWWQTYNHTWSDEPGLWIVDRKTRSAILRQFEASDAEVPIAALRCEIVKRPCLLSEISTKKMEQLVGSVFAEFYCCDVEHVGRSGDAGIDLFLILGDKTIMVQVKRRELHSNRHKSEPVESVRALLGATLLQGSRDAIYVTNAERYSPSAVATANHALMSNLVDTFELVNGSDFLRRLSLVQEKAPDIWRQNLHL